MNSRRRSSCSFIADRVRPTRRISCWTFFSRTRSDSAILFATNKAELSQSAKNSLAQFSKVLNNNADLDIAIIGHTDNTGNDGINQPLSVSRAQSVNSYLLSCGVKSAQIKRIEGQGSTNPVADNSTAAGRKLNRRVEVYMYASQKTIQQAQQAN